MCFSVCANRQNYNKRSCSPATASNIQPAIIAAPEGSTTREEKRTAAFQTASMGGRPSTRALSACVHDTVRGGTKWFSVAGGDAARQPPANDLERSQARHVDCK
ncbi:MAG TPA: hypothetical protein VGB73_16025 [Pyrinomonadaceae bacterium]